MEIIVDQNQLIDLSRIYHSCIIELDVPSQITKTESKEADGNFKVTIPNNIAEMLSPSQRQSILSFNKGL